MGLGCIAAITAILKTLSFPLNRSFSKEKSRAAGGADRPISRGGGADMYPDSGTKGGVTEEHGLKDLVDEEGEGGGGEGSEVKEP